MYNIHIVGAGSLGSTISIEIARRALALSFPLELCLYDYDEVEERNVVAQAFLPSHIGMKKVDAVYSMLEGFTNVEVSTFDIKIGKKNNLKELNEQSIIIDCVDNIPTRQLLWKLGVIYAVPVIHVGMSEKGSGYVQWNYTKEETDIDTFHLSPTHFKVKNSGEKKGEEDIKLPPCELNSMRTLILNTSMAAVNSLFIFLGMDISSFSSKGKKGTITNWVTDLYRLSPVPELEINTSWQ